MVRTWSIWLILAAHPFSFKKLPCPAVAGCSLASRWSRSANCWKVPVGRSKNRDADRFHNLGAQIWRFPEMGVHLNHPFYHDFLLYKSSILGYPYLWNPPIKRSIAEADFQDGKEFQDPFSNHFEANPQLPAIFGLKSG